MSTLEAITPAAAVLETAAARLHCRIDHTDEDTLLDAYIAAAMVRAEELSGRPVAETVYRLTLDAFPAGGGPILLPRPPVTSVDAVSYLDRDGNSQALTVGNLQVDTRSQPARILPAVNAAWPATQSGAVNVVTVTYTAAPTAAQSAAIVQAVRLAVGDWFEHREDVIDGSVSTIPNGFDRLLRAIRFRDQRLATFLNTH